MGGCCDCEIDLTLNPVGIAAFALTCLGCIMSTVAVFLTNWWSVAYSRGGLTMYGVWSKSECNSNGYCHSDSATMLEGGQETLFVTKVFTSLTAFLTVLALLLHVVYFLTRKPLVRTVAIFMLGAAVLFGLLAIFVFIGFYTTAGGDTSLGVAFFLFVIGVFVCLAAAAFTAWASIRKAFTAAGLMEME